jgi:hypothetical protein
MNFTIKLKQIDAVELSGFIGDVAGGGSATTGLVGQIESIPSGVSGVHISWSSRPDYVNATIQSSGAADPLLMGNLRGFNATGCSYFLSDVTRSNNYYLHLSYPI